MGMRQNHHHMSDWGCDMFATVSWYITSISLGIHADHVYIWADNYYQLSRANQVILFRTGQNENTPIKYLK